jgi:hypothetical protein
MSYSSLERGGGECEKPPRTDSRSHARVLWSQGSGISTSAITEQATIINAERLWQLTAKSY